MVKLGVRNGLVFSVCLGMSGFALLIPSLIVAQANSPAVKESSSQDSELAEAERLDQQVILLYQQGKYSEAIPLAERALAIRRKILNENPDVATSLNNLAQLYENQGRYSQAELLYRQALEMRKRLLGDNHLDVASSLNNLAGLYQNQGRYSQAEPLYRQALEMKKRLLGDNHPLVASSLNNLAALYRNQGRYSEAEPLYRQALEMRKRLLGDNHPDVAQSLNNLAVLYYSQGRYSEAEPLLRQALEMCKRLLGDNHPDVAASLNNLAELYEKQGRYSEAEPLLRQALEMSKRLLGDNHPDVATSLNNLPLLYEKQGRYSEAEPLLRQALEMRKHLLGDNHPDVAESLSSLAGLYLDQGRYSEAEPLLRQALEMRKRLLGDNRLDVATSLNNLAALYYFQGRYSEAEPLLRQALEMKKRLLGDNHPDVATSLNNLAQLYYFQGRYSEAEPLYRQALEMYKRLLGDNHPDVATIFNNLAELYYFQGRYSEAEPLYRQTLEMRKRLLGDNHPDVAQSLNNLAQLYEQQGHIPKALEFLEQGLQVEEKNLTSNLSIGFERQKRDYIKTISGTTNWAISLHLNSAPNSPEAAKLAIKTIFQRKGRILDILTNNLQILRQRVDDKESQKLIDELSNAYTQLTSLIFYRPEKLSLDEYRLQTSELENKVKQLEDKLSRRSAEFRQQKESLSASPENIQKLIPADAALVEIYRYQPFNSKASPNQRFGKPRYAAYILSSAGESQGIDLGEAVQIESTLELFRESVRDPGTPTQQVKQSARDLDKLIMQPVRKLLGNKRKILISPDGALNLIPFEALVDENNHYLVENYSFTYLTSGRDLLRLQNQFLSKQPPVVMGNPNYNKPGEPVVINPKNSENNLGQKQTLRLKDTFSTLPGTGEQAIEIAHLLGVKPLLDSAASEANLKQVQSPKFLIIGTHGFFKDSLTAENQNTINDNPLLQSGLIFAGYKQQQSGSNGQSYEDGILSAQETTALNLLGTKIVVLSACDTGVGKDFTSEGLYSLRRALVIAGSESQVISLWKVSDDATKDLMVAYFKRVLTNSGRSEALRQTQLEMLHSDKYQHPYYWAAFIPSGDWREMR